MDRREIRVESTVLSTLNVFIPSHFCYDLRNATLRQERSVVQDRTAVAHLNTCVSRTANLRLRSIPRKLITRAMGNHFSKKLLRTTKKRTNIWADARFAWIKKNCFIFQSPQAE